MTDVKFRHGSASSSRAKDRPTPLTCCSRPPTAEPGLPPECHPGQLAAANNSGAGQRCDCATRPRMPSSGIFSGDATKNLPAAPCSTSREAIGAGRPAPRLRFAATHTARGPAARSGPRASESRVCVCPKSLPRSAAPPPAAQALDSPV